MSAVVGVDTVTVARMTRLLERSPGFALRYFTSGERRYCEGQHHPAESYAARFAAKEAARKVLGCPGGLRLADIEVTRLPDGQPALVLHSTAEAAALHARLRSWSLSLTHSDCCATAFVAASP